MKDLPMPTKKIERNYLAKLTTANARIWFRYRSQIISDIKGNQSTQWTGRMQCRHCNTGCDETQEHIERCTHFAKERATLNLDGGIGKLIFWRRVVYKLKCMKLQNKDLFDHKLGAMDSSMGTTIMGTVDSSTVATSEDLATMQVHTYPVPSEEARTRGREGLRTSAGVALSARDISVGEMAYAIPRSEMLHTG